MFKFTCPICYAEVEGEEAYKVKAGGRAHAVRHEPASDHVQLVEQNTKAVTASAPAKPAAPKRDTASNNKTVTEPAPAKPAEPEPDASGDETVQP